MELVLRAGESLKARANCCYPGRSHSSSQAGEKSKQSRGISRFILLQTKAVSRAQWEEKWQRKDVVSKA